MGPRAAEHDFGVSGTECVLSRPSLVPLRALAADIELRVDGFLKRALARVEERFGHEVETMTEALRECEAVLASVAATSAKALHAQELMVT